MCECCKRITDPAKDIFIRTHMPETREEYRTNENSRFCPVCGREIVPREMEEWERKENRS